MLRRIVLVVLAAVLVLGVVAGCASQPAPTNTPVPQPTAVKPAAVPPTAVPATAVPTKKFKVALVCGLLGDRSFLDSAARGIKWVNERLPNVETKIIENNDVGEQQLAARAMAEEGYDLIITIGYGSADFTTEIAKAYPNTKFALVDANLDVPNGTGLVFKENEGSFTVGMVAAMLTKTGKVGYVGGIDVPLLRRFEQGYIDGVKYVNPNVQVVSGWVGAFNDPTKGKELALTQYQEGADIIYAAAGKSGEGVLAASKEKGLYSIGVDSDQCYIAPGNVICSMMKMVDVAVYGAVESLTQGKLEAGNRSFGLKENATGLCWLYDTDTEFKDNGPADMVAKMPDILAKVKTAVESIKAGTFCVADFMKALPCDNPAQPGGMPGAATTVAPGEKFKVALVCGLLGDRSFLDSAARGIKWVNERLPNVETKIIENNDVGEQQLAARAMAEEGYDLIITIGYGSADFTTEIAKAYPNTKFALVDANLDVPNGTGLVFKENEGSFTVGMVAAMLTKTGKVGYVGGIDVPLLRRFEQGYIDGVKYVNPNVQVVSGWVGAFNDPTKGKELALTQYQEGADIIYAAAGKSGEGVLAASKEKGLYSIGVDSDQCYIAPGNVICSMMKMVDVAVYGAVESLTQGKLEAGNRSFGLKENATGLCWLYDTDTEFKDNGPADMVAKMPDILAKVKTAVESIKAGTFCVADFMKALPCDNPAQPGGMPK